jgi:hypothetical protein
MRQSNWSYLGRGTKRFEKYRLNDTIPSGWSDSGAPIAWFSPVSDLSPQDFFLWLYVINFVYQGNNNDLQVLKACVRDYVVTKTHNVLQNM